MNTSSEQIIVGETVTIDSPGHRQHSKSGTVIYHGIFMGTIGVEIDGERFGFLPSEVIPTEDNQESADEVSKSSSGALQRTS